MTPVTGDKSLTECTDETVKETLVIVVAFLVIILTVQQRMPNWNKLALFLAVFVPVAVALKHYHADLAKTMVNAAGFALGTNLFDLLSKP